MGHFVSSAKALNVFQNILSNIVFIQFINKQLITPLIQTHASFFKIKRDFMFSDLSQVIYFSISSLLSISQPSANLFKMFAFCSKTFVLAPEGLRVLIGGDDVLSGSDLFPKACFLKHASP